MNTASTPPLPPGWQPDGSYVPCQICGYEPKPYIGLGTPVGNTPGVTIHDRSCQTLPRLSPAAAEKLRADLAAIAEAERRAWIEMHDVVIR